MEAAHLHGTSSFGMSGVNAHLLLSPPPHPHSVPTPAMDSQPLPFSRSRIWPAPPAFHAVQMVKVAGAKVQFAADLTHPALASAWGSWVGGSQILPTSMLLEAAAAAASVAAGAASGSRMCLQGLAVSSSMILEGKAVAPSEHRQKGFIHIELDTFSGMISISSMGTVHATASAASMRDHRLLPSASLGSHGAEQFITRAAQQALPLAAAPTLSQELSGSAVGGAVLSDSFQDGFCTHCGKAEAALTLASMNLSPTAQPTQTLTACSAVQLPIPNSHTGHRTADDWSSAQASGRKGGVLSADCIMISAAGPGLRLAAAVFATHPLALQPSGLGLQLLWKPIPLAALSPQACHRKWLLISMQGSGNFRILADGWDDSLGHKPQVVHIILTDKAASAQHSDTGRSDAASTCFVENEDELQAAVKREAAEHCFIVQATSQAAPGILSDCGLLCAALDITTVFRSCVQVCYLRLMVSLY